MLEALRDRIAREADEAETTAIICRTAAEARAVWEACSPLLTMTLQTEEDASFHGGITVMPFYLAKGLEFDSVHIPGATKASYHSGLDRQALYIACTRALHRLSLYCDGEKSPFLPE